jgi:hypothetical protein
MTRTQKRDLCRELEGVSENEARERIKNNGLDVRVERRDGEFFPGTMDYREDRVNLFIENGKINHAEIG